MDTIIITPELKLTFPTKNNEQACKIVGGFESISDRGILSGCIGAIDGWLCKIISPSSKSVGDVKSFFSGHYHRYGINVQICCDHMYWFTAFTVNTSGSRGDSMAFQFWRLNDELKKLNRPYYVVGDSAYTLSPTVMTPFTKRDLQNPHTVAERDNYNFFLSQLRIRIEMAIGILVNKWRVFKTPIHFDISKCHKIITSTIRLHNYVINHKIIEKKGHFNPEHEEWKYFRHITEVQIKMIQVIPMKKMKIRLR